MGTYLRMAGPAQGSRPVYQLVGPTVEYLYYWPGGSAWRIGGEYTSSAAQPGLHSGSTALCPELAAGWQVWSGSAWVSGLAVKVRQGAFERCALTHSKGA
jgi:hypothetical protein